MSGSDGAVDEKLMQIGELAERTGLSLPTLRHYDETGLLAPSGRSPGNFRLYSESDYERLMVIRRMKPLGFSVEQMRSVLDVYDGLRAPAGVSEGRRQELLGALREVLDEAVQRRDRLQVQLDRADEFISVVRAEMRSTPP